MSKIIDEISSLIFKGWRPYRGEVQPSVYEQLTCDHGLLTAKETRIRPYWFSRGDVFLCVGCYKKCSLSRPAGFMPPLPINYDYDPEQPFRLTPQELVKRKHTLRVEEVAYCLNVSIGLVYRYKDEGRLTALREKPIRIRASDVEAMMSDFDE